MNRVQHLPAEESFLEDISYQIEQSRIEVSQRGDDQAHALFMPLHYEPNYGYPLLIWLHGPGDNESQLKRIMPLVSMRNYIAIAPRGTCAEEAAASSTRSYCWRQTEQDIVSAERRVLDCIGLATQRFNVDRSRVFLAGYDCGGTMACRLAMKHPERFGGVASIGGSFPSGHQPLLQIDRARQLPLMLAHGRDSTNYPIQRVCEDLRLLHTAGMKVTLRQYPCEDELTTKMLSDLDAWMMDQVSTVVSSSRENCYRSGELN